VVVGAVERDAEPGDLVHPVGGAEVSDVPVDTQVNRDEGAALILALIMVLVGAFIVTPLLSYGVTVTRGSRIATAKNQRAEAVKGALRVALADPKAMYDACSASGLHNEVTLASPSKAENPGGTGLDIDVHTVCTTVKSATELQPSELRVAMTTTQSGSTAPAGTVGDAYAGSGSSNVNAWVAATSTVSTGGKILLPELPTHSLTHPSPTGYQMPSNMGSCTVYFPGTYADPITISGTTPVYFTSGIYYFENTLTFTGSANVVVGGGAIDGCASDQDAAYNAINAPLNHNITGFGATFVFGGAGRLVVNDSVAGTGPVVQFNTRMVADTDVGNQPSKSVSIETVDGVVQQAGKSSSDLNLSNQLYVPKSMVTGSPSVDAATEGYNASTLVPTVAPATQSNAVIDVSFTGTSAGTLYVPGYVAVPQGRINVSVTATSAAKKSVSLLGGVLAALVTQSATPPATLQLGIVNRVVQKTFKVVSTTQTGAPVVVSTALVQVNDYGEYVVNSWQVATS
jgi:hypothetical protein